MENSEPSTNNASLEVSEHIQPSKVVHLIPKNSIKNSALHVHVSKEPKYVPYEPYKAAVKPRMPYLKQKKTRMNVKKKDSIDDRPDVCIHQRVSIPQVADITKEVIVPANITPPQEEMKLLNISIAPVSFQLDNSATHFFFY